MKKLLVNIAVMLVGVLVLGMLFAGSAQAGRDSDAWTRVHSPWPFDHGYYKLNPNGVVQERWWCNSNWEDCQGFGSYYPVSKFAEPPMDTPCGENMVLFTWEGGTEYSDDEADVSDFLSIGTEYWFCNLFEYEIFRASE